MKRIFLLAYFILILFPVFAQTENHQDTIDYALPFFKKELLNENKNQEMVFPKPSGIMFNYIYQISNIYIEDFKFGTKPENMQQLDFVKFSPDRSEIMAYNVRADFWILPFLNVYANYATANSTSELTVEYPFGFPVEAYPKTESYGLGFTTSYGYKSYYMAANFNFTWTNSKSLVTTTKSQIISVRFGKNIRLGDNVTMSPSVGFQYQNLSPYTMGKVDASVVYYYLDNPIIKNVINNGTSEIKNTYDHLSTVQKKVVDKAVQKAKNEYGLVVIDFMEDTNVEAFYFSFNKRRMNDFAGLVGLSFFVKNRHMFRMEGGVGQGFYNGMLTYNYRFGIFAH